MYSSVSTNVRNTGGSNRGETVLALREVEVVLSEPKEVTIVHTLIPVLPLATNAWAAIGQLSWPHRPEEPHGHKHASKGALE